MRFPPFQDLDQEQRFVYGDAPHDQNILVIGAPGTGKTIMAIHRALKLKELGKNPKLIMYGRVLSRYTNSGESETEIKTQTMHQWIDEWWSSSSLFHRLKAPRKEGSKFDIDWIEIFSKIKLIKDKDKLAELNWGHLIIDEGQDFEKDMYITFHNLSNHFKNYGLDCVITVFADENQRLDELKNSSIEDIQSALRIKENDEIKKKFYLRKNYRNTSQVHTFSKSFQVYNRSYEEISPSKEGPLPDVLLCKKDDDKLEFIKRKVQNTSGKQIGIIIEGTQNNVFAVSKEMEKKLKSSNFKIQTYISGWRNYSSNKLDFNSNNTITILHKRSAKGTEFDIVIILGLENENYEDSEGHNQKMSLYVTSSRPRDELIILFSKVSEDSSLPSLMKIFPKKEDKICNYRGLGTLRLHTDKLLQKLNN